MHDNLSGDDNVSLGTDALYHNNTGTQNLAMGTNALKTNLSGNDNCAFGYQSLLFNTIGIQNIAIGTQALASNTTGDKNVALGYSSLYDNYTGTGNTGIGYGSNVTNNINNATALGYNAEVSQSNSMLFGNTSVTKWGFGVNPTSGHAIQVGSGSTNGNGAYLSSTGVWTNASDRNKKENFTSINGNELLEKIASLPITRWKYKGSNEYHIGPMAQDFYALFNLGNDDKSISTIDPAGIALAGVQQLKKENDELKQMCGMLLKRIEKLENK